MKITVPDYYSEFRCIADKCQHSCCIGWEIDIDKNSYEYYKNIHGEIGERLRSNISCDGEAPHFKTKENGRCPFLNGKSLCDIFIELGEEKLCEICTDHPRFRNFFADRTEVGLGLCCEAAGELIIKRKEKMKLECGEDDFSYFRQSLFDILQNRDENIEERIDKMLEKCSIRLPDISYAQWRNVYLSLERLDRAWETKLEKLKDSACVNVNHEWETAFEQLAVYFVYRHLADGLYDGRIAERAAFAALSVHIIKGIFSGESVEELIEIARMYSSEIEYCEDNMEYLLSLLEQY